MADVLPLHFCFLPPDRCVRKNDSLNFNFNRTDSLSNALGQGVYLNNQVNYMSFKHTPETSMEIPLLRIRGKPVSEDFIYLHWIL
jgi:hypothetical protein